MKVRKIYVYIIMIIMCFSVIFIISQMNLESGKLANSIQFFILVIMILSLILPLLIHYNEKNKIDEQKVESLKRRLLFIVGSIESNSGFEGYWFRKEKINELVDMIRELKQVE